MFRSRLTVPAALLTLLAAAALPATSRAGTFTWKAAAGGSFQDASSWSNISPTGPPGLADTALFNLNSAYAVTFTGNATNAGFTQTQGTVTFAIGGGQTYQVTGANSFTVGNISGQTASLNVINGIVNVSGGNRGSTTGGVGVVNGSTGNLFVSGPAAVFTTTNFCDIGVNGTGLLQVGNNGSATLGGFSYLGTNGTGNGTVAVLSGGTFSAPSGLLVGQGGTGDLFVFDNSSATVNGLTAGNATGSHGTVTVGNGNGNATLTVNNGLVIGNNNNTTGALNVGAGGTLTSTGGVSIAANASSNGSAIIAGTWNHSGGSIFVGGSAAGAGGTGSLTENIGGILTVTGAGNGITTYQGHGTLTLNGGTINTPNLTVPAMPILTAGVLNITGGAYSSINDNLNVLAGAGKTLSVNLLNGSTFYADTVYVGGGGTSTFTVQAGSTVTNSVGTIGVNGSTNATLTVTGTGSVWNGGIFVGTAINSAGNGTLNVQSGGTVNTRNTIAQNLGLHLGFANGATGTATVAGGGAVINADTGAIAAGDASGASGTLTVGGGGTVTSGTGTIGRVAGATGVVTLGGASGSPAAWNVSTLAVGGDLAAAGGSGTLTLNPFSQVSATSLLVWPNGIVNLNGGTLAAGAIAPGGQINVNGGTMRSLASFTLALPVAVQPAGGTFDTNGFTLTVTGPVTGSGPLTKAGAGTLSWQNPNYAGRLDVQGGTLQLNGGTLTGGATVSAVGTLSLNGTAANLGALSIAAAAGGTVSYSGGASVLGGFLRGPGTHVVTGATTLIGVTATVSAVVNQTGPSTFTNATNGGALNLTSGATLDGFTNQGSGAVTVAAGGAVNVADFQSYGVLTLIPGSTAVPTLLINTGSSPLYFNGGSRTFIGTPATAQQLLAGIDLHGQNAVVAGGLFVNNGFVADSSPAGTATIVADFGAVVKGAGFFQNSVVTQNGGKFQAGNSPGSASFGKFIFGPGGVDNYAFAIDDATGTAGPHPNAAGQVSGWGLVRSVKQRMASATTTGDFTWTASPTDKLVLALDTLVNQTTVGTDVAGLMADFDPLQPYNWPAIKWSGTYAGPTDAAALNAATSFDTSGFVNPVHGTFGWSLDATDQTMSLTYTPTAVPEPGTLALSGIASIGWVTFWRRRWQSSGPSATLSA